MLTLMTAALVAAQPAPAADAHAQHAQMPHAQAAPMQKHEGMKMDCCKECCKDMEGHDRHTSQQPKRGE